MTSPGSDRVDESAPEIGDREVDLNGSRVHYLRAGDGPHLVLLHGLGDSARDWQWVLPALARRFRAIAPDFPGFGERDRVVPLAQARDAVGRLRRGRLAVIPDCGHVPQIVRPELFLEALSAFLEGPIAGAESGGSHAG